MIMMLEICAGACLGALSRWGANLLLNPLLQAFPLGTLAVNWLGSLGMGVLLALFQFSPQLEAQWKLPLVTGFLGSFTTFSAFAGELAAMLMAGRFFLCAGVAGLHVFGSVLMVFLGFWLVGLIR